MRAIHRKLSPPPRPPREYPYLAENSDGLVVLFDAPKTGTVVRTADGNNLGYNSQTWPEDKFLPLHIGEEVVLVQ